MMGGMKLKPFNFVALVILSAAGSAGVACNPTPDDPTPTNMCVAPSGGPTMHSTYVTGSETWTADTSPHVITQNISVTGTLTIEPCAQVQLADDVTVNVGPGGSVIGLGDASHGITIGASQTAWGSFFSHGGTIRFAYTSASGGGVGTGADIGMFMAQRGSDPNLPVPELSFDHVTLQGSQSNGVVLRGTSFDPASTALTITGAAQFPIDMEPVAIDSVPTGAYTGNGTDELFVMGGVGAAITTDETMHDRGVPYRIGRDESSADLRVGDGTNGVATLTIEPGVTLRFAPRGILEVEHYATDAPATGALVALGTAAAPIVFTSAAPAPAAGDWIGVSFASHLDARDALDHVRIEYAGMKTTTIAGCPLNTAAQAALLINGYPPASEILTNSEIVSSAKDGVFRDWIGNDIDFASSNTFTAIGGCKQTNVLIAQGVCPKTMCQ